jgi:hypothetical protein
VLPASTWAELALKVTPTPCHAPFTLAVLLMDCATMAEFPVTVIAPETFTVDPPPMVSVAPFCTVKLATL